MKKFLLHLVTGLALCIGVSGTALADTVEGYDQDGNYVVRQTDYDEDGTQYVETWLYDPSGTLSQHFALVTPRGEGTTVVIFWV